MSKHDQKQPCRCGELPADVPEVAAAPAAGEAHYPEPLAPLAPVTLTLNVRPVDDGREPADVLVIAEPTTARQVRVLLGSLADTQEALRDRDPVLLANALEQLFRNLGHTLTEKETSAVGRALLTQAELRCLD